MNIISQTDEHNNVLAWRHQCCRSAWIHSSALAGVIVGRSCKDCSSPDLTIYRDTAVLVALGLLLSCLSKGKSYFSLFSAIEPFSLVDYLIEITASTSHVSVQVW